MSSLLGPYSSATAQFGGPHADQMPPVFPAHVLDGRHAPVEALGGGERVHGVCHHLLLVLLLVVLLLVVLLLMVACSVLEDLQEKPHIVWVYTD
jgi:hypothetical protein